MTLLLLLCALLLSLVLLLAVLFALGVAEFVLAIAVLFLATRVVRAARAAVALARAWRRGERRPLLAVRVWWGSRRLDGRLESFLAAQLRISEPS